MVYGGYNLEVPTRLGSGMSISFTYCAGTDGTWGFTTYRSSLLTANDDTGRMYLFGGSTNTIRAPSGKDAHTLRSFRDLWELRLDGPGGHWDEVSLSDERSAQMGLWQKCFNCRNTGFYKEWR